jgi:hypothetical protein
MNLLMGQVWNLGDHVDFHPMRQVWNLSLREFHRTNDVCDREYKQGRNDIPEGNNCIPKNGDNGVN